MAIKIADFIRPPEPKKQANVLIIGAGGNGKSTYALRFAPEPVAFISLDRRGDYAAYEEFEKNGRDILFVRVPYPANFGTADVEASKRKGQASLDKIFRNFDAAVEQSLKGNIRTIVVDTMTEFGEISALAARGKLGKVKGDYGKSKDVINRDHWRLFNTARDGSANFIALGREREEWIDNVPTGAYMPRAATEVVFDAVDWAGRIHADFKKVKGAKKVVDFSLEIIKAGIDISTYRKKYTEEDWGDLGPFVYSCMMNYPGTDDTDWS